MIMTNRLYSILYQGRGNTESERHSVVMEFLHGLPVATGLELSATYHKSMQRIDDLTFIRAIFEPVTNPPRNAVSLDEYLRTFDGRLWYVVEEFRESGNPVKNLPSDTAQSKVSH